MKRIALFFAFLLSFSVLSLLADPIPREAAVRAADASLPLFFPGSWHLADEFTMHNLEGEIAAYVFMFALSDQAAGDDSRETNPSLFLNQRRETLRAAGEVVSGNAPELSGSDRFATIVISANDTDPPVIRAFRGLPPHLIKEPDALSLVAQRKGAGSWRVRQRLMLGMFDEAFLVTQNAENGPDRIVEMRTGSVIEATDALNLAQARQKDAPCPERVEKSREAWSVFVKKPVGDRKANAGSSLIQEEHPGGLEIEPSMRERRTSNPQKGQEDEQ